MGILLWPFKLVFWLTGLVLSLCGKLITIILGLVVCALGLMLCATLIGLWPVSYTHLDVYKRQPLPSVRANRSTGSLRTWKIRA